MRYLSLAFSDKVFPTAIRVALLVGTLLAVINHYQAISSWSFSSKNVLQILFTYLVPYCVSTYSSMKAILERQANDM